jgi:hypothetical protein
MARVAISCPFSGEVCTECAIYRGRHFYLCFEKMYRESGRDITQQSGRELRKTHGNEDETSKRLTGSPASPRIIFDVEDLIEAEKFSRLKEKGETHDT